MPLDKFEENIETCDLLINSTSLGMEGIDTSLTLNLDNSKKELFVYDIVYSPLETNLLSSAENLILILQMDWACLLIKACFLSFL